MSWSSAVVTRKRDVAWEQVSPPDPCYRFLVSVLALHLPARQTHSTLPVMPTSRFEPSSIKNKIKREEIARKEKKTKRQDKLQRRLAQAKVEANDPLAKKVRARPRGNSGRP